MPKKKPKQPWTLMSERAVAVALVYLSKTRLF